MVPTLRTRKDFLAVRKGKRFSGKYFIAQAISGNSSTEMRVGYTITTKTGNAVERNRIRRRLKHALVDAQKGRSENGKPTLNGDMVLVARRDILGAPWPMLVDELTKGIDHLATKGNKTRAK